MDVHAKACRHPALTQEGGLKMQVFCKQLQQEAVRAAELAQATCSRQNMWRLKLEAVQKHGGAVTEKPRTDSGFLMSMLQDIQVEIDSL